ncbi:MAG: hypothetical protein ACTSVG_00400 [Alphaproteobacteria bacterium]
MRCMGRMAWVSVFLVGFALSAAGSACAGAWTQAKGEGLAIITIARHVAPVGALTGGPISSDTNVSQVYLEYGLFEGLTIGAKSYVELSTTDLSASSASLGGFARKRVWRDGRGGVASVQFGYAHPIDSLLGTAFANSEPGAVPEAHLAGLYGRGWGGTGAPPSSRLAPPITCAGKGPPTICVSSSPPATPPGAASLGSSASTDWPRSARAPMPR